MSDDRPVGAVSDLLRIHRDIERAVVAARMCGVAGDQPLRGRWVAWLDLLLRMHIGHEEAMLLPVWARVSDAPPNATAEILRAEHRRILALVEQAAVEFGDAVRDAEALATLAAVLEHHDAREAGSFKVRMDALLPAPEREAVLRRVEADLARLPEAPPLPNRSVRRPDGPASAGAGAGDSRDPLMRAISEARAALITDAPDAPGRLVELRRLVASLPVRDEARRTAGARQKLARTLDRSEAALAAERAGLPNDGDGLRTRWLGRLDAFDRLRLVEPLLLAWGARRDGEGG